MATKTLYEVTCLNFVKYGGRKVVYYTQAFSVKQAKRNARLRFNRENGFRPESFVEMTARPAKPLGGES